MKMKSVPTINHSSTLLLPTDDHDLKCEPCVVGKVGLELVSDKEGFSLWLRSDDYDQALFVFFLSTPGMKILSDLINSEIDRMKSFDKAHNEIE